MYVEEGHCRCLRKANTMNEKKLALTPNGDETNFYKQVAELLVSARQYAKRQLDGTIVTAYYEIGRMIVEREQQGQKRAQYGAKLIKGLSEYLTQQYGRGFSVANLKNMRQFYQVYSPSIQQSLPAESQKGQSAISLFERSDSLMTIFDANSQKGQSTISQFNLDWTHYQVLMRIDEFAARRFYEIEAANQQWTVKELQRTVFTCQTRHCYNANSPNGSRHSKKNMKVTARIPICKGLF